MEVGNLIDYWLNILGLGHYKVNLERISRDQVVFPEDIDEKDKYFVGVSYKNDLVTITHDRDLTEEDIVHELLHIAFPEKDEAWINMETMIKLKEKTNGRINITKNI